MSLSKKKTSPVWEFFDIVEDDNMKAACKLCPAIVSRGGSGKMATTSAMSNHLKLKHPSHLKGKGSSVDSPPSTSRAFDTNSDSSQGVKRKQPTLEACLERKKLWDINDTKSVELHYAIGEMIAIDNQPFSVVSDLGFKRLLQKAQPKYQIPSRNYFSDNIVPDIYSKVKNKIALQIEMAEALSFTSDIWSSVSNYSFISLTAHWINIEFERKSAVLNINYFPESHTGLNIGEMLQQLMTDWDVSNKIHILIRDNAPNMVKATTDANIPSASCFIHTLQLVISDSIESQRVVKDIIAKSRKIVTHFNHSPLACNNLRKIQVEELHATPKKLIQDVSTRWNSTFYMLQRLLEQKRAISLYSTEYGIDNLKAEQWAIVETILRLLQPFEEITKIISSKSSNLSEVIPTVSTLKLYLSKTGVEFFGVGTMKDAMQTGLEGRFSNIYDNKFFLLSTLLDPRFKTAFFSNEVTIKGATSVLEEEIMKATKEGEETKLASPLKSQNNSLSQEVHMSFWHCFSEIANTSESNNRASTSNEVNCSEELRDYLALSLIPRNEDPLLWWRKNQISYPVLAKLARKYLSAPASSVDSERLFSEAGNICEPKRNRLLPQNAEQLLFLHHNLPLLNFKYD